MEGILNLENWRKFGNDWVGYYIYCVTENCNIGYPIKYCPVCGAKLE